MAKRHERIMTQQFERCSHCGAGWTTKEDFLADRDIRLEGYQWDSRQVRIGMPPEGVLVFTHAKSRCGTSLTVAAKLFRRASQ